MGITHFDQARRVSRHVGHLRSVWTFVGYAAGSVNVGLNRIQVEDGGWSTPAHVHGRGEEIFYVLGGRGLAWLDGQSAEIGAGDCLVCLGGDAAHTLFGLDGLDVLAFGDRFEEESIAFPRQGASLVGSRYVQTLPGRIDGVPAQFVREADIGPPELPAEPGPRPASIVNVQDVEPVSLERPRVVRERRAVAAAAGSVNTGLKHCVVAPNKEATPPHCHSMEEEMFVVLDGDGLLVLGDEEHAVRPGSVVARPAATGVAHMFRAGEGGLTFLAYGPREPGDVCYYPRSNKIGFRGVGVIARLERLDYWDGED